MGSCQSLIEAASPDSHGRGFFEKYLSRLNTREKLYNALQERQPDTGNTIWHLLVVKIQSSQYSYLYGRLHGHDFMQLYQHVREFNLLDRCHIKRVNKNNETALHYELSHMFSLEFPPFPHLSKYPRSMLLQQNRSGQTPLAIVLEKYSKRTNNWIQNISLLAYVKLLCPSIQIAAKIDQHGLNALQFAIQHKLNDVILYLIQLSIRHEQQVHEINAETSITSSDEDNDDDENTLRQRHLGGVADSELVPIYQEMQSAAEVEEEDPVCVGRLWLRDQGKMLQQLVLDQNVLAIQAMFEVNFVQCPQWSRVIKALLLGCANAENQTVLMMLDARIERAEMSFASLAGTSEHGIPDNLVCAQKQVLVEQIKQLKITCSNATSPSSFRLSLAKQIAAALEDKLQRDLQPWTWSDWKQLKQMAQVLRVAQNHLSGAYVQVIAFLEQHSLQNQIELYLNHNIDDAYLDNSRQLQCIVLKHKWLELLYKFLLHKIDDSMLSSLTETQLYQMGIMVGETRNESYYLNVLYCCNY